MSIISQPPPLVTILMITYNHEHYLADAIQGVINQICDFEFELIIGEDCSQDATRQIALDYERQYPNIIRVVYSDKNMVERILQNLLTVLLRRVIIAPR